MPIFVVGTYEVRLHLSNKNKHVCFVLPSVCTNFVVEMSTYKEYVVTSLELYRSNSLTSALSIRGTSFMSTLR